MEFNLLNDINTLTTIPLNALYKLTDKANWCICNSVEETFLNSSNIAEISIGALGTLIIEVVEDTVEYRFIPSKKLDKSVIDTIINKKSPLINQLDSTLASRLVNTYKDLF